MLVSTVIPTYNRAAGVVRAVESAIAQTYPANRHDIVVVDDGSTDDTAGALARFEGRIRYFRTQNSGVSAARNYGVEMARGEAIAFLDSDDTWVPEKISRQVEVLRTRRSVALVLTGMLEVNLDGSLKRVFSRRSTIPEDGFVIKHVLRNPSMTPSTAMVRTSVFHAVGGFDTSLHTAEDLDLHLRIAMNYEIAVIDLPLVTYLHSDEGLSGNAQTYHDYVFVMERFFERHGDRIPSQLQRESLFLAYLRNASGLLDHGEFSSAAALAWKGLLKARTGRDAVALAAFCVRIGRFVAARCLTPSWLSRQGRR